MKRNRTLNPSPPSIPVPLSPLPTNASDLVNGNSNRSSTLYWRRILSTSARLRRRTPGSLRTGTRPPIFRRTDLSSPAAKCRFPRAGLKSFGWARRKFRSQSWDRGVELARQSWPDERRVHRYGDQKVAGATSDRALNVLVWTFGALSTVGSVKAFPRMSVLLLV